MAKRSKSSGVFGREPLWYKDAIIYEVHVRAFHDSNGDGIGDFPGLIEKLDYLQDLGVTALWILPFYPSPLRDDGYDIADYTKVNPSYGTVKDFRRFLDEAHRRSIRVITELVINHTSVEHPWFERARRAAPGSNHRDFYVWSDDPKKYGDTRIIFQDFENSNWAWDPVAGAYYWHRFYSHQPDLNFDNPNVHRALFKALDFWLDMGVDGLRLDAIPYLYEREGTNCENLPETHAFLKLLRAHVDERYEDKMLLAEANQWPEDAASYFGDGDECHMNFHFPVMPRMFMAVQQENNFPILDILEQTPSIPDNCQWALFLRNHDELTLEMVTDEDRDYMYRVYAEDPRARINLGIRRRLAPLLKDRRKVELMHGLLLSLPGTPVLYYGDEIGMGDNFYLGDRDAVRTPMQWSGDRNAGFSRANPQRLFLPVIIDPEYHYEAINVEAQQNNPQSLLWWIKHIIDLRKQHKVFGRGTVDFLQPDNPKVLAFVREHEGERMLVVANLSRFAQYVELDLSSFEGISPVELFGQTEFPRIGQLPYLLTLSPHGFYWLALEEPAETTTEEQLPRIETTGEWSRALEGRRTAFEKLMPAFLARSRWFRSKARVVRKCTLVEILPLGKAASAPRLTILQVAYDDSSSERYLLPVGFATGEHAAAIGEHHPHAVIANLRVKPAREANKSPVDGVLYDALVDPGCGEMLLKLFGRGRTVDGKNGVLSGVPRKAFPSLRGKDAVQARVSEAEQSNTNVVFGDRLVLKAFRALDAGPNPDVEITGYLSAREFKRVPMLAGSLEYATSRGETSVVGILQQFVPNQGDAWQLTLDALDRYFERALSTTEHVAPWVEEGRGVFARSMVPVPEVVSSLIGDYLPLARTLGERTAELHLALSVDDEDTDFTPEPLSTLYQRALYQSGRTSLKRAFALLRKSLGKLDPSTRALAEELLASRTVLDAELKKIVGPKIEASRIRCHGDYHLGQVLYTGGDFIIIDFEGEPGRAIGERRLKRSPLRDVAGMLRSFHYAAITARRSGRVRGEDERTMEPWDELWYRWVSAAFLRSYLERAGDAVFMPSQAADLEILINFFRADKCIYELAYELNNRPTWVDIPLRGLAALISSESSEAS